MSDEQPKRSDLTLVRRALREDWPMSPKARVELLRTLRDLTKTAKSKRTQIMAARTLIAALGLNVKQQTLDLARDRFAVEVSGDGDTPSARDVVEDMAEAACRYEREHPDEAGEGPGGAGEVPREAGEIQ